MASTCRTCRAPVLWRRNDSTGKLAPLDATPTKEGNCVILDAERYRVLPAGQGSAGEPRYLNHWATCKNPPAKGRR
jgi:hypothetical protein